MRALDLLWLVPALPFLGAAVNGLLNRNRYKGLATAIGVGAPGLSLLVALAAIWQYVSELGTAGFEQVLWAWTAGDLAIDIGFRLDPLSAVMMFVVTFVGFWIHLYSVGYMGHEAGYRRYFSFLNLFMGSMLLLVLGNNLLVLFVGWEGVGLCSYLLIGFYFEEKFPPEAGKKAFIVNRIGDFAFLVGMFAVFQKFGTLHLATITERVIADPAAALQPFALGLSAAGFIALCFFVGATGKSAQIPLYVWLPDAMAGPTPVSALIHAATMVTAGVYMVVRTNAIYQLAPEVSALVAIIGCATAIFAATIAIAQNDIKKVLAYSTVSQLGYMFLAAGVGAYKAAIFHLATHAFFKACLFLGSGSVIHAMGGEQDMRQMGGLARKLPSTYRTFLISTLAIAGVPGLAGFFSKDEILGATFLGHVPAAKLLWIVGLLTAGLTACYMFRLVYLTFHGRFRGTHEQEHHLHESPAVMTVPLWILAVGAIGAGWFGIPSGMWSLFGAANHDLLGRFLAPVIAEIPGHAAEAHHASHLTEALLIGASIAVALFGIWLASRLWGHGRGLAADDSFASRAPRVQKLLAEKYRVDELYDRIVVRPLAAVARGSWKVIDTLIIDGALHVGAFVTELVGDLGRFTTTGNVRHYGIYFLGGVVLLFWWMVL
ncbi:MAG: NADH-quinone oxidoreductase subunit L [Thermoanaerobaculia bacterium]|nr:MAG: NADH-quinone oxidoreductase subunit L [Thermoanaerobaculia bacterium]MBZ0103157.1 NADH-quinone oxidoreductase subunit L [Thermoanaerobaculia bacterium]